MNINEALAVKYRPHTFEDVVGQEVVIKILKKQVDTKQHKNCYLFSGSSGCGKTSIARIFARELNNGQGTPIEIDAASNNGVDYIRDIVSDADKRALDAEYKVYIIDECHALSNAAWQAFLKCIEEPPKYTIFIFCTTNPEKVPLTVQNRVQKFTFTKIRLDLIANRLKQVCKQEHYTNYEEACHYIATISNGGMRTALAHLDKCQSYSTDLSIENVLKVLGDFSYKTFFELTNAILDRDTAKVYSLVEDCYNSGNDLKLFIDQYLDFVIDVTKFCLFKEIILTNIPNNMMNDLLVLTDIEHTNSSPFFQSLSNEILKIKNAIKGDTTIKLTVLVMLSNLCRGD